MADKVVIAVDSQIAALVPRYLANRGADIGKIRAALAAGDFESVRVTGHAMKGSGGGYGFSEITRLGAAIEEGARERGAARIGALVANLESYLASIEVVAGEGK